MRLRILAAAALVAAVALPVASASAADFYFQNPLNGCTYHVWGPDVTVHTLPKPGVTKTGGTGESVSCT